MTEKINPISSVMELVVNIYAPARDHQAHAHRVVIMSDVVSLCFILLVAFTDHTIFKWLIGASFTMRVIQMIVGAFWGAVAGHCKKEITLILKDCGGIEETVNKIRDQQ
jgi:hypothetical protein